MVSTEFSDEAFSHGQQGAPDREAALAALMENIVSQFLSTVTSQLDLSELGFWSVRI